MATRQGTTPLHDPADQDNVGRVPPENEPGHHPDVEQDKPIGRRPRPKTVAARRRPPVPTGHRRFDLRFDGRVGTAARVAVLRDTLAYVDVTETALVARFGLWLVSTPLSNIEGASITGPYRWWKVAGGPRVSMADRGLTFATNADRGVCIRFREPVPGVEPTGTIRHPGLTVTVADPQGLVDALAPASRQAS